MNTNIKQRGSAHLVIIALLTIALLGALGFVYYQNFVQEKPADDTSKVETDKTADPVVTNEGYFVLEDWGVKFKLPAGLTSDMIAYKKGASSVSDDLYYISTVRLSDIDANCSELFRIVRGNEPFNGPTGPLSLGQVDSYYYGLNTPQSVCAFPVTTQNNEMQTQDAKILEPMFRTIEKL